MNNQIWHRQWLHLLILAMLLIIMWSVQDLPGMRDGSALGLSSLQWFWISLSAAILMQVYVWFCWRLQLYRNLLTRIFDSNAFTLFASGFSIVGILRVVTVFILAWSNRGTLPGDDLILQITAILLLIPALWLFYSVKRYFGIKRAMGIDHFEPEYRNLPFVREGIFCYTDNGMYTFGFLIFWVPALWFGSIAAIFAALFNHLYIWVHYYTTELPDIEQIYGDRKD